jgi:hypothetical protein
MPKIYIPVNSYLIIKTKNIVMANLTADSSESSIPAISAVHNNSGTGILAQSQDGTAINAYSTHNTGIYVQTEEGTGVFAQSNKGTGISVVSNEGVGLNVSSKLNTGISASSEKGVGVYGTGEQNGGEFSGEVAVLGRGNSYGGYFNGQNTGIYAAGGATGVVVTGVIAGNFEGQDTAIIASGDNYGGKFYGRHDESIGVYGTGLLYGGYFDCLQGNGVYGRGNSYGGYFNGQNTGIYAAGGATGVVATGVTAGSFQGQDTAIVASGDNYGGKFYGRHDESIGVYGTGVSYGGSFDGGQGTGVLGRGNSYGGYFNGQNTGIYAAGGATGVYGKGGTYAGYFEGIVLVTGDIQLQNADCAEEFDIVEAATAIEPGTVMVLNSEGKLQPSENAYDKCVAGVISGAGDYKPGIVLDRKHEETKRLPIALVGKVYCKVDADHGAIEVGDLLTTSPTSGHAMRAGDILKAFGTVLGKALSSLKTGKGLIPVLVALQ